MTHLDKGYRISEDSGGNLLHNKPHNLLCHHHHLIMLLLTFDAMGEEAGGIPRICKKTV